MAHRALRNVLSPLVTMTAWGRHERFRDAHFTNKKMRSRKMGDLPKV